MVRTLRLALLALAVAGLVWLLFTEVFPRVEVRMENPNLGALRA